MQSDESRRAIARMLRQERHVQAELMRVIRQHLIRVPGVQPGEWLDGLRIAFERLREHLIRILSAKEKGGYLKVVTDVMPTLSDEVEAIRREHAELLHMADRILTDLRDTKADQPMLIADACARIQRFMAVVEGHDQKETMLTLFVFSQDLHAED